MDELVNLHLKNSWRRLNLFCALFIVLQLGTILMLGNFWTMLVVMGVATLLQNSFDLGLGLQLIVMALGLGLIFNYWSLYYELTSPQYRLWYGKTAFYWLISKSIFALLCWGIFHQLLVLVILVAVT